jgi:hypothetical protein
VERSQDWKGVGIGIKDVMQVYISLLGEEARELVEPKGDPGNVDAAAVGVKID